MGNFFEEGGFGMYPTMIFGFFLVAAAVFTLLRPERRWPLVVSLGVATFGAGLMGTTVGLINTMKYVAHKAPEAERLQFLAQGVAESLNNLELALFMVIPTALVCCAAALRSLKTTATPAAQ